MAIFTQPSSCKHVYCVKLPFDSFKMHAPSGLVNEIIYITYFFPDRCQMIATKTTQSLRDISGFTSDIAL